MCLEGAGRGLTWELAAAIMAGRGPARPYACGRWLPVWLPGISLATLTFECPEADSATGSRAWRSASTGCEAASVA